MPRVQTGWLVAALFICNAVMEQENFEKIMAKIHKSKTDVEKHLAAMVADLKAQSLHCTGEDFIRYFIADRLFFVSI